MIRYFILNVNPLGIFYNKTFCKGEIFFLLLSFQSKIIRVLNLWQKNGVFEMSIIQPLMDMSNGTITPSPELEGKRVIMNSAGQCL